MWLQNETEQKKHRERKKSSQNAVLLNGISILPDNWQFDGLMLSTRCETYIIYLASSICIVYSKWVYTNGL